MITVTYYSTASKCLTSTDVQLLDSPVLDELGGSLEFRPCHEPRTVDIHEFVHEDIHDPGRESILTIG